ncbi:P-loop containing nucleoside triphosphate hydrolase protein [Thamnocephalis sphaerospora]|uniref:P-loop containing nucleoside triphosphate hydrolase protein n=1 Tax=Thamnocephalis sphaerospora TaxID=78915 RepID=A0A4V1IWJ2_9FUNG|nr:P-loop containing nucleoside triphosphate hydrolase protein [Thamnocephalis sphaerospora]|eukprot:RKP07749.1 P-loop containing nucleoside triphosphate hydrolase protein [Thamnocephalis sphaerospora]
MSTLADLTGPLASVSVGILGHVDSGKTSLARRLSSIASTAAFDKNPQSRERGITLDLGFSGFCMNVPAHWTAADGYNVADRVLVTLVDCPGHASLVRTVIGGAQIIDVMLLVVDATKGIQTQTAECLVLAQIIQRPLLVALNKVDMFPADVRETKIAKVSQALRKAITPLGFGDAPIVPTSAGSSGSNDEDDVWGISALMTQLSQLMPVPARLPTGPFLFAVDHCFGIRGKGTVLTGTVLSGTVKIGDTVEIVPGGEKKVKSMQRFRQPVQQAIQGDRIGLCVTQFDPEKLERGLAATPGTVRAIYAAVINVRRIPFYKLECRTRAKFHVTIGYETAVATATFFSTPLASCASDAAAAKSGADTLNLEQSYAFEAMLPQEPLEADQPANYWALLEFDRSVAYADHALAIVSRLDTDIHTKQCRLAFYGNIVLPMRSADYRTSVLPQLHIFKDKMRTAVVDRVVDEYTVIARGLVQREAKLDKFIGMLVTLPHGIQGRIESTFGQSGKFRIRLSERLTAEQMSWLASALGGKGKRADKGRTQQRGEAAEASAHAPQVCLRFRRFVFDADKKMVQ